MIDPNPFTSGGARWNIMAVYGTQIEEGKSEEEAQDFVEQVLANTSVQDESARDSLETFSGGKGDVLRRLRERGHPGKAGGHRPRYVTPDSTILIENPIAVTKDAPSEAQKFLDYLYTDAGAADLRRRGLPPGREVGRRQERTSSRRRPACSRSTTSVAGARSPTVLRRQRLGDPGREGARQPDELAVRSEPSNGVSRHSCSQHRRGRACGPPSAARRSPAAWRSL